MIAMSCTFERILRADAHHHDSPDRAHHYPHVRLASILLMFLARSAVIGHSSDTWSGVAPRAQGEVIVVVSFSPTSSSTGARPLAAGVVITTAPPAATVVRPRDSVADDGAGKEHKRTTSGSSHKRAPVPGTVPQLASARGTWSPVKIPSRAVTRADLQRQR